MSRAYPWIYGAVAVAVLGDRIRILIAFAARYTDKDQALLWTAAHELLGGHFREPRFYGQTYNSLVEGWLAAPLVASGLPVWFAVPTITALLAVTPFLILSIGAWRAQLRSAALVILALPLLLPFDYSLITSMPRGFVVGIAVAAVAAALLQWRAEGATLMAGTFLATLACSLNPNAFFLVALSGLLVGLRRYRSAAFYRWALPGAAVAAALHLASALFYLRHPEKVVYGGGVPGIYLPGPLDTSPGAWLEGLRNLDRFFGAVTPVVNDWPFLLALVFGLVLFGMIRFGARLPAIALSVTLALILISLSLERVHMGSDSISWPWSRPYLAVPLVLAVALIELERVLEARAARARLVACVISTVLLGGVFAFERSVRFGARIRAAVAAENRVETGAWPVETVRRRCDQLAALTRQHGIGLIVFQHAGEILAYSCEPLLGGTPKTLLLREVVAERRSWRLAGDPLADDRGVLFYNVAPGQLERGRRAGLRAGRPMVLHGVPVTPAVVGPEVDFFELLVRMELQGSLALRARARSARE